MSGFKSKAERRKARQLVIEGKMRHETFTARLLETPLVLPERIHPKRSKGVQTVRNTKVIK